MSVSGSRCGRMAETKLWRDQQREISPERTKVWAEPSNPKSKSEQRVAVVYYLSRNGQLEHPHFMEVPLSSPQGLFLRDVISRLDVLRGIGMAVMYSWSCKRSYKNGFVWHDLLENDFIYPAHANEYVLKGSELPQNTFLETVTSLQKTQITTGDADYQRPSDRRRRNQSCSSIDVNVHEYSVYKLESPCRSAADASTQTDDVRRRRRRPPPEIVEAKGDEIEISPPPSDSSPETLETLMKADGRLVLRPDTTVNEESTGNKACKSSSVLMQLISCGSMSFRDCGAGQGMGLISQYKMRVPRATAGSRRVKLEEKEYFSGSIVETKKEEIPKLKRSNSYNAGR